MRTLNVRASDTATVRKIADLIPRGTLPSSRANIVTSNDFLPTPTSPRDLRIRDTRLTTFDGSMPMHIRELWSSSVESHGIILFHGMHCIFSFSLGQATTIDARFSTLDNLYTIFPFSANARQRA